MKVEARKCLNCGYRFRKFSWLRGYGKCPNCGSDLIVKIVIDTETDTEEVVGTED